MWKRIRILAARFWHIAEDVERNKADLAEVRQELHRMGRVLGWWVLEFRHTREQDSTEREKLLLRLENEFLKLEKRLPRGKFRG